MHSPLASFFAPVSSTAQLTGSKASAVLPVSIADHSAGANGLNTDGMSFFDLLMMTGTAQNTAISMTQNTDVAEQPIQCSIATDSLALIDELSSLPLVDSAAGMMTHQQMMGMMLNAPSLSSFVKTVIETESAHSESTQAQLIRNNRPLSLQPLGGILAEKGDLSAIGTPTLGLMTDSETVLPSGNKSASTHGRELSKNSFLSIEKSTSSASPYVLKVDPSVVLVANDRSANPQANIAEQTEQLLRENNATSVQVFSGDAQLNNASTSKEVSRDTQIISDTHNQANVLTHAASLQFTGVPTSKSISQQTRSAVDGKTAGTTGLNVPVAQNDDTFDLKDHAAQQSSQITSVHKSVDSEDVLQSQFTEEPHELSTLNQDSEGTANTNSNLGGQLQSELLKKTTSDDDAVKVEQVRFVLPNLTHATAKNGTSIVIDLEPRSLGRAELRLTIRDEVVHAELRVNSNEAKQAVEANLDQLQKSLERAGVTVSKVDVSLSNQGDARQFGQQHGGWNRPQFKVQHQRFTLDESLEGVQSISTLPVIAASTLIRPLPGRSWTA